MVTLVRRTRFSMIENRPNDTPSIVTAEGGEVLMCGPDGRAYALTVEAAVETSARLLVAAADAGAQRVAGGVQERVSR